MIAVRKRPQAPVDVVARRIFFGRVLAGSVAAFLLAVAAHSAARTQLGTDTIYGVTARGSAAQGVALLRHCRADALRQPGNMAVRLLQNLPAVRSRLTVIGRYEGECQ
jgi:hypothetical protein